MKLNKAFVFLFLGCSSVALAFNSLPLSSLAPQPAPLSTSRDSVETIPEHAVVDEVIWVVGDEPILKSDVEVMRINGEMDGLSWRDDPDCAIPEQIAVQKLYLHQAAIDSIEVTESEIASSIDRQINYMIQQVGGSREKLEEYMRKPISQIREQMREDFRNQQLISRMREKLVEDVTVTPAEVRAYFKELPEDSIPFVPTEVEVQIVSKQPRISQEEINRVKNLLREYTERVSNGETTFSTLARLYSEDPGTARQGGELGYTGRGMLDPAFANVAFNLTDPAKISKIVETEFGFHIIQLIDKRGDKVNVRHILRKPVVTPEAIDSTKQMLDSVAVKLRAGSLKFDEAVVMFSDDKDTRMNHGLMAFNDQENGQRTSRFQMKDLPSEVAREVETLQPGEISNAFEMFNDKGKKVVAIILLKNRVPGHRATITEDFQVMKAVVLAKKREKVLHNWVVDKIKHTYVRMNDRYKSCNFEYEGWVK